MGIFYQILVTLVWQKPTSTRSRTTMYIDLDLVIYPFILTLLLKALRDLDEEFRDNNLKIITRFYLLFESIHTYIVDLNQFLAELDDGLFIHQSAETIMADVEGKQLFVSLLLLNCFPTLLLVLFMKIVRSVVFVWYNAAASRCPH